jgi:hypothetical protein
VTQKMCATIKSSGSVSAWPPARQIVLSLLAPTATLVYPFLLALFHRLVSHHDSAGVLAGSLVLLAAIFLPPLTGISAFSELGSGARSSSGASYARGLALVSVAAAPLYTTLGVLQAIAHISTSDLTTWVVLWSVASAICLWQLRKTHPATEDGFLPATVRPRLRFAHGISAALIVCLFLASHLLNHLSALLSLEDQKLLMTAFRHVYRSAPIEPILVGLMFFQMITGSILVYRYLPQPVDFRRTLQLASGTYLLFYIPGHMNSVFIYARMIAGIPTDWRFATGAPTGLLFEPWNIRLVPHYLLGVFFVVAHLILGARGIALAHGVNIRIADRWTSVGILSGAILALGIMLGMIGLHLGSMV